MDTKRCALIGAVTIYDTDGEECGKAYSTVSGEVGLSWGYGEDAVVTLFDPDDLDTVITALRVVKAAAE